MKVKYLSDQKSISLTKSKAYTVLSIESGWYRIVDDTGEDYLYPAEHFEIVDFSSQQIAFMESIGIKLPSQLTGINYAVIEEKVSKHLQAHGFDENYMLTESGQLCESILDLLPLPKRTAAMDVNLYDRVLLTDGNPASIVEILEAGKFFLADIDKNGDTYTEDISAENILRIL